MKSNYHGKSVFFRPLISQKRRSPKSQAGIPQDELQNRTVFFGGQWKKTSENTECLGVSPAH